MTSKRTLGGVQGIFRISIFPFYLVVIVLVLSIFFGFSQSASANPLFDHSEKAAMREMSQIAENAANLLNVYMDARVTEMLVCSRLGGPIRDALTTSDAKTDANQILQERLKTSGAFDAILLLDKKGVCIASAPASLVNQDLSNNEAFKGAVTGKLTIIDAHKSEILTTLDTKSKGWTVVIAVPVKVKDEIAGVLVSCVKWSKVWELMIGTRVGVTGYVFVVNNKNQVVLHPVEQFYGKSLQGVGAPRELDEAIKKKTTNQEYEFKNPRTGATEKGKLAGFVYPKGYGNFPGLGWVVGAAWV